MGSKRLRVQGKNEARKNAGHMKKQISAPVRRIFLILDFLTNYRRRGQFPFYSTLETKSTLPSAPLARLAELHAPDLRFTWAEAETFLNQVMRLGLSGEQITQLESHAEGRFTLLEQKAMHLLLQATSNALEGAPRLERTQ
jgi:hypothetical protein